MPNIKLPNISAPTEQEQIIQIKRYLQYLAQTLNGESDTNAKTMFLEMKNDLDKAYLPISTFDPTFASYVIEQGNSNGWIYKRWKNGTYEMYGRFLAQLESSVLQNSMYWSNPIEIKPPFKIKSAFASGMAACNGMITNAGLSNNGNVVLKIASDGALDTTSKIELCLHVVGTYS